MERRQVENFACRADFNTLAARAKIDLCHAGRLTAPQLVDDRAEYKLIDGDYSPGIYSGVIAPYAADNRLQRSIDCLGILPLIRLRGDELACRSTGRLVEVRILDQP